MLDEKDKKAIDETKTRIVEIRKHFGRDIRIAHVTPARNSLVIQLNRRLGLIKDYGFEHYGISGDYDTLELDMDDSSFTYIRAPHLTRKMDLASDALLLRELYGIFRKEKFDVVVSYGPKPGVFARCAARIAGIEYVIHTNWGLLFTEHSSKRKRVALSAIEYIAAHFGDAVLSVNRDDIVTLENIEKKKLNGENKVRYLGNGCHLEYFDPKNVSSKFVRDRRAKWGVKEEDVVVGMISRYVREKGCLEYIAAARDILSRYPKVRFVQIGREDKNKKDAVDPAAFLDAGIILPGWDYDIRTSFAAMDIMVLPSHREGFPRTLVEASAMGKPIVTTDTRGCREAIEAGKSGYLVQVGDSKELAGAIERLIVERSEREELGRYGRERATRIFDDRLLVNRFVSTIAEVMERKLHRESKLWRGKNN